MIRAWVAVCHSSSSCSAFFSFHDVIGSVLQRDQFTAAGQIDRIFDVHPLSGINAGL
jgi:hypothetical protein